MIFLVMEQGDWYPLWNVPRKGVKVVDTIYPDGGDKKKRHYQFLNFGS